jgi:hypothetical protein
VKLKRQAIHKSRPRLAWRVRKVMRVVWGSCGSSCRHLVGIACVVAIALADREGIIGPKTAITSLYKAINLNWYITLRQIQDDIRDCDYTSEDEEENGDNEENEGE